MPPPNYSQTDYAGRQQILLPRGKAWPRDQDTTQFSVFTALGNAFARLSARAANLLVDSFPRTTLELLPEWESSLRLPDPCAGPAPTIAQRQAQVLARFTNTGGQAAANFIALAAQLGYSITIEAFAPFRAGVSRAGDPANGQDWFFAWAVKAPLNTIQYFAAGQGAAGEPLATWGNAVLECELNAVKPSHTVILFEYS